MEFFIGLLAIFLAAIVFRWFFDGRRISHAELESILLAERRENSRSKYVFDPRRYTMDLDFKRSMSPNGKFHPVSVALNAALSTIASHLKYKKHEWIVFAICKHPRVMYLWCNKGPDGTMVYPNIAIDSIITAAERCEADLVIRLHNHPNPNPSRYSMFAPSDADQRSFEWLSHQISDRGIDFLDVICERGDWLIYAHQLAHQQSVDDECKQLLHSLNVGPARARRRSRQRHRQACKQWSSRDQHVISAYSRASSSNNMTDLRS